LTETAANTLKQSQVSEHNRLFDSPVKSGPGFAHPSTDPPALALVLTRTGTPLTRPLRLPDTPIDDPVRRCQFCPAATMAVLIELEIAGRVGTLPDNRAVLLTDEAHWNE
jgi:hypothetical protein